MSLDASICSVRASSPISFTAAQGTPAFSMASSHSARGLAFRASAIIGSNSALWATRCALFANFGSVAHSSRPSTLAQRAHSRSLPGARQIGWSAVSKVW